MLIALNRSLRSRRRQLAAILAIVLIAGSVLTMHSAFGAPHSDAMGKAAAICVAVMDAAALAFGAVLCGRRNAAVRVRRFLGASVVRLAPMALREPARARVRAGPALLQVFQR